MTPEEYQMDRQMNPYGRRIITDEEINFGNPRHPIMTDVRSEVEELERAAGRRSSLGPRPGFHRMPDGSWMPDGMMMIERELNDDGSFYRPPARMQRDEMYISPRENLQRLLME